MVKERVVKLPVPETEAPVSTGLMKVWFSVKFWTMTDLLLASASLCLVTVGLSSVDLKFRA